MTYATVTSLEHTVDSQANQINRLENELRKMQGRPSLEEEQEEREKRWAERGGTRETSTSAYIRTECERQKAECERWLTLAGVPSDADDSLKRVAMAHRQLNVADQGVFARLAFAIAGKNCKDERPGVIDTVKLWSKLSPDVQLRLNEVIEAYQGCVIKLQQQALS